MLFNKKTFANASLPFGTVVATNLSEQKGTAKHNVAQIEIDARGVVGDAHAGFGHRQVSLLNAASLKSFSAKVGKDIAYGAFGENVSFTGLDIKKIAMLDRLQIGDVELEVTQIGKKCHGSVCAIYREVGKCVMPTDGFFTRVVRGGAVKVEDAIAYQPYNLRVLCITLSDRAAQGAYADKSGELAQQEIGKFFDDKSWRWQVEGVLLPDDAGALEAAVQEAITNKIDIIFTLGGTGVGVRDITPEVVSKVCTKFLPGIMEHIRLKYGALHPAALLSRSIAGIADNTQIYTLPGSPRAVFEYLAEIFKVVEHVLFTLHGIDRH